MDTTKTRAASALNDAMSQGENLDRKNGPLDFDDLFGIRVETNAGMESQDSKDTTRPKTRLPKRVQKKAAKDIGRGRKTTNTTGTTNEGAVSRAAGRAPRKTGKYRQSEPLSKEIQDIIDKACVRVDPKVEFSKQYLEYHGAGNWLGCLYVKLLMLQTFLISFLDYKAWTMINHAALLKNVCLRGYTCKHCQKSLSILPPQEKVVDGDKVRWKFSCSEHINSMLLAISELMNYDESYDGTKDNIQLVTDEKKFIYAELPLTRKVVDNALGMNTVGLPDLPSGSTAIDYMRGLTNIKVIVDPTVRTTEPCTTVTNDNRKDDVVNPAVPCTAGDSSASGVDVVEKSDAVPCTAGQIKKTVSIRSLKKTEFGKSNIGDLTTGKMENKMACDSGSRVTLTSTDSSINLATLNAIVRSTSSISGCTMAGSTSALSCSTFVGSVLGSTNGIMPLVGATPKGVNPGANPKGGAGGVGDRKSVV